MEGRIRLPCRPPATWLPISSIRTTYRVCRAHPEISIKILAKVGARLRHLVATIESITFGSVTRRLAQLLLDMSREAGRDEFPLPITRQELASRLGTVRELISRNLMR